MLVGQVRRVLSVTAVRAQAECLLSRLRHVVSGTGAACSTQGALTNISFISFSQPGTIKSINLYAITDD